jgi:hypothetical protein
MEGQQELRASFSQMWQQVSAHLTEDGVIRDDISMDIRSFKCYTLAKSPCLLNQSET